jgi:peptidoglycan glycosyltransferase
LRVITPFAGIAAFVLLAGGLVLTDRISDNQWLMVLGVALLLLLVASRVKLPDRLPTFNRSLIRTTLTLAAAFVLISAQLVRIQVADSESISTRTAVAPDGETIGNPRLADSDLAADRGEIFDRNGNLIAGTEMDGDQFVRTYPNPVTSYVAGYYSPLLYGATGLEDTYNQELSGQAGNEPLEQIVNGLLNRPQEGADLYLTLDESLQQQASDMMGGATGSVVVMDVQTGAVLVMVSNPHYDPGMLFTSSRDDNDAATAYWEELIANPDAPLVLRANQGLYTPGSTFKTVTAAIAIELGVVTPDQVFEDNGQITIDGRELVENNRPDNSRDEWTVREGLAWSLNVVFAQIGLEIGAEDLWDMGKAFGFGADVPFDLPVAEAQIASDRDYLDSDNAVADTAFGQGQILVSPLQMCMVVAMYANGGDMMQPYLVSEIADGDGRVTSRTQPEVWRSPISGSTADQVEEMMVNAVNNGSVSRAASPGYVVGGKTGTAETGDGSAHSWFIGFIGNGADPRYAVAVTLEQGSGGLANAVGIGRDILIAAMEAPDPER